MGQLPILFFLFFEKQKHTQKRERGSNTKTHHNRCKLLTISISNLNMEEPTLKGRNQRKVLTLEWREGSKDLSPTPLLVMPLPIAGNPRAGHHRRYFSHSLTHGPTFMLATKCQLQLANPNNLVLTFRGRKKKIVWINLINLHMLKMHNEIVTIKLLTKFMWKNLQKLLWRRWWINVENWNIYIK